MDVNDHRLKLRSRAFGMVTAGMSQKEVASTLNVSERSIRRWYKAHKFGETLETKERSGRPPKFHRVAKIIIVAQQKKAINTKIGNKDNQYGVSNHSYHHKAPFHQVPVCQIV